MAMPPGRIADFERVLTPGFEEATGAIIETLGMRSSDQVARLRIEKDNASMDVLWIDVGEAQLLAKENLLAKVDESDLPNLSEVRDEARSPAGIAPITFSSALGFLYNEERLPEPPGSWAELWAPHLRGERALFDFGSTVAELLLDAFASAAEGRRADPYPDFIPGSDGDASLWFVDTTRDPSHAALVNGTLAHHAELDDGNARASLHGGVTVIPAALAVAETTLRKSPAAKTHRTPGR